jgi:hypothetical protein
MTSPLVRTASGWLLPVEGWTVIRCFVDPTAFGLLVDGGTGDILRVYIEGEFTFAHERGEAILGTREQGPIQYAPLLGLMGEAVHGLYISTGGDLRIEFKSGAEIRIAPDPHYEAWQLDGLGNLMVVCTPGGGEPSIFDA